MLMQYKPELGKDILMRKQNNSIWMTSLKRGSHRLPDPVWEIIDDFQQLNRRLGGVVYPFCPELSSADAAAVFPPDS